MITVYDPAKPARSAISAVVEYLKALPWAADYDVRPESIPLDTKTPLERGIITIEETATSDAAIGFNDYLGDIPGVNGGEVISLYGRWQEMEFSVNIWTCRETGGGDERAIIDGHLQGAFNTRSQRQQFSDATGMVIKGYKSGPCSFQDGLYRMEEGSLEVRALFTDEVTYQKLREIYIESEEMATGEITSINITSEEV